MGYSIQFLLGLSTNYFMTLPAPKGFVLGAVESRFVCQVRIRNVDWSQPLKGCIQPLRCLCVTNTGVWDMDRLITGADVTTTLRKPLKLFEAVSIHSTTLFRKIPLFKGVETTLMSSTVQYCTMTPVFQRPRSRSPDMSPSHA
jgi:hypothetical protein